MIRQQVESNRDDEQTRSSQQDADQSRLSPQRQGGIASIQRAAGNQAIQRQCQERGIQAKLTVNEPSDKYEKEAERVADAVMRMPEPKEGVDTQGQLPVDRIQRMCPRCRRRHRQGKPLNCEECEAELQRRQADELGDGTSFDSVEQAAEEARKPGKPLPERTRTFFEDRMVGGFSSVRIHTGPMADQAARSVNAKAYTLGSDIVFRSGEYRPDTRGGKRLLAHELTHVLQQNSQSTSSQTHSVQGQETDDDSESSGSGGIELHDSNLDGGKGQSRTLLRNPNDDLDAGVSDDLDAGESSRRKAHGAFLDLQIKCVIRRGGCPRTRPAGIPTSEEIKSYDTDCRAETGYNGPPVAASDLECDTPGLGIAKSLNRAYPGWLDALPDCPCTVEEAKQDSNPFTDWTSPMSSRLHPGAEYDFRSSGTKTAQGTNHGQQCTYDSEGKLIVQGAGAGTPDVWSPDGNFKRHILIDFEPAQKLSGATYRNYWVPNTGHNCSSEQSEEDSETDVIELEPSHIEGNVYTVESGDTLWDIAKQEYGDGRKWPVIFERNKKSPDNPEGIENPDLIYSGQTLIIPPRSEAKAFDRSDYVAPK